MYTFCYICQATCAHTLHVALAAVVLCDDNGNISTARPFAPRADQARPLRCVTAWMYPSRRPLPQSGSSTSGSPIGSSEMQKTRKLGSRRPKHSPCRLELSSRAWKQACRRVQQRCCARKQTPSRRKQLFCRRKQLSCRQKQQSRRRKQLCCIRKLASSRRKQPKCDR